MRGGLKLRTKLIWLFFASFAIGVTIMGALFYGWARDEIADNAINNNNNLVVLMETNIASFENKQWLLSNIAVQNPDEYGGASVVPRMLVADPQLSLWIHYDVGHSEGFRSYTPGTGAGLVSFEKFQQTDVYERITDAAGKPVWFLMKRTDTSIVPQNNADWIIMARQMREATSNYSETGALLLGADIEIFGELCQIDVLGPDKCVAVILPDNTLIYSAGLDSLGLDAIPYDDIVWNEDYGKLESGGRDLFVFRGNSTSDGCSVLMLVPADSLVDGALLNVILTIVLVVVFVLAISLLLIYYISGVLTRPTSELLTAMDSLGGGDWNNHVEITSKDEIGELGMHYNDMIDDLQDLLEENYVLALREREAELTALQAQINPHFLYNTLNTFYVMSFAAEQYRLANLVIALSQMFRISLSRGDTWIPISAEKEFLGNYLMLQKEQMGGRFEYTLDIAPNILSHKIPKLILQPFVENALLHGLSKRSRGGKIEVSGSLENDRLIFIIQDNGMGMDDKTLKQIRNMPESAPTKGYALWNVRERLRLYFHGEYILQYDSKPGEGVRVYLEIPAEPKHLPPPAEPT